MTSISFEAALKLPDNDASNLRLYKLVSARDFSSSGLRSVAQDYLSSFCDPGLSVIRRRWIGIALAGMLEMPAVATHIETSTKRLRDLGAILLSGTEQEQIKIIAGIIIRQALEQGIDYSRFWSTEKVRHSAPDFPLEADAEWMQKFQGFLDILSDLALARPTSEPSVMYLVSLFATDGFKWRESSATFPVALVEAGMLTIIAPDEHLKNCQFVDIPVEHILNTRSEPSKLHNSQAQPTEHEPWDLVMTLTSEPWSYRLDSTQRIATDLSLMFKHSGDALEWESCIKAHQKKHEPRSRVSRNLPIDASSPSIRKSIAKRSLRSGSQTLRKERVTSKKLAADSSGATALQLPSQHPSSTSKRTYGKGKLPRVSRATKQDIFKKLNSEDEALDALIESKRNVRNTSSDISGVASSPRRTLRSSKTASDKEPVKTKTKARTLHNKNGADDDEDFIPSQTRPKTRTNPKRKATPDPMTDDNSRKRSRKEPNKGPKSTVTGAKQQAKTLPLAKPSKPPSSVPSSRHTLIGGLLGLQRPAKISESPFKKPTLPARVAQTPSTPTKPSRKPVGVPVRPQPPVEARRCSGDDALHYMASSPPVADEAEENDEWHHATAVEAAMLSSNSKPTPASPNAESTAISGHADCEDIASEKKTGDWQTAKSDPFGRRSAGKKATSFIRRLTGEDPSNEDTALEIDVSNQRPSLVAGSSAVEDVPSIAASRPFLQKTPSGRKEAALPEGDTNKAHSNPKVPSPYTGTGDHPTQESRDQGGVQQEDHTKGHNEHAGTQSKPTALSKEKTTTPKIPEDAAGNETTVPTLFLNQQFIDTIQPIVQADQEATKRTRNLLEETQQTVDQPQQLNEGIRQLNGDGPIEQAYHEDDTLIGVGEDNQEADDDFFDASPIHLQSSPPHLGSSSSHSSTSAVREPLTDPPLPTSQAEEMDWEASLQPHQRDLHELMIRTSKRVMQHIVGNETSVDDIAEMYAQDGEHVLSTLIKRHDTDYEDVFQGMESTKGKLRKELQRAAKQMAKDRERVDAIA
ncbi:uncharacterized protein J4E78_003919 [Alternaria triticimaculans]|uniref:uncharacterized protein n=1 Tax=Alternaria triticimaculans TaxID=297637 RepID=UPI0020C1F0BC|nr:uncharacterized protein J4E78_003919 [Alternaria triticimaculans]KAI4663504.1 hypothetical protein J4E78_003919 [Alternaria triticimaculans]